MTTRGRETEQDGSRKNGGEAGGIGDRVIRLRGSCSLFDRVIHRFGVPPAWITLFV
jgi:hypothetical protein